MGFIGHCHGSPPSPRDHGADNRLAAGGDGDVLDEHPLLAARRTSFR